MRISLAILVLSALFVGCAPKATFDVSIANRTDRPVTVGLVKEGPPFERDWAGPEQLAIQSPLDSLPPWGHVIPPGKTMDSGAITGAFPAGTTAYLRVYRGQYNNATLLAISSPNPDRTDVLLFPGRNLIVIGQDAQGVHAQRLRPSTKP